MNALRVVLLGSACLSAMWIGRAAAEDRLPTRTKSAKVDDQNQTVGLFDGMAARDLEVRYIPHDESEGRVFITNRSGETLNVELPATFAAVPVLAQVFPGFPSSSSDQQTQQEPQRVSGPFDRINQRGRNDNNNHGATPFVFAIPSEQVAELRVTTVCMDHGAPTPRAEMPYQLVPLAMVSDDPAIEQALVSMRQGGDYQQAQVQAAVWHLVGGKTWSELAAEKGKLLAVGKNRPRFKNSDLEQAKKLVETVEKQRPAQPQAESTASVKPAQPAK